MCRHHIGTEDQGSMVDGCVPLYCYSSIVVPLVASITALVVLQTYAWR